MKSLKEEIYMEHQQWATIYSRDMAIGLPILARLAVDGIVNAVFTNYSLKMTQAMNMHKKAAF